MGLLTKLFNRKKDEKIEETKVEKVVDASNTPIKDMPLTEMPIRHEQTVFQKYLNGLPLMVLEDIDYSKFGAMLKQERLLPPSYDRKPIKVEIDGVCDKPRVMLTFKSTTSESVRMFSIYGYNVAYSEKINQPVTILEVNHHMSEEWRKFAENVMWAWDRGYRYSLIDQKRKGETPKYKVSGKILNDLQQLERSRELENNDLN